jgi:hypothetical protein
LYCATVKQIRYCTGFENNKEIRGYINRRITNFRVANGKRKRLRTKLENKLHRKILFYLSEGGRDIEKNETKHGQVLEESLNFITYGKANKN